MPVMLFKLRGVDEEEAEEIRELLTQHEIDFYETTNGRWGLGFAAIWLDDESVFAQAKSLIDQYQINRFKLAREEYEQLRLAGKQQTFWRNFKANPIQVILILIAVIIVSLFVLSPFMIF